MTPDSRLGMIPTSQFTPTSRAGPADTRAMRHADVHTAFRRVQLNSLNKPGLGQPKYLRIQVRVLHGCPPGRRIAAHLPTENPEGPERIEQEIQRVNEWIDESVSE